MEQKSKKTKPEIFIDAVATVFRPVLPFFIVLMIFLSYNTVSGQILIVLVVSCLVIKVVLSYRNSVRKQQTENSTDALPTDPER